MTNMSLGEWVMLQDTAALEKTLAIILNSNMLTPRMETMVTRCAGRIQYSRNPESAKKATKKHYDKVMKIYRANKNDSLP